MNISFVTRSNLSTNYTILVKIGPAFFDMRHNMSIFGQFFDQLFKKIIYAFLNSEVTGPMFTKFLQNVEASSPPCIYRALLHAISEQNSKE